MGGLNKTGTAAGPTRVCDICHDSAGIKSLVIILNKVYGVLEQPSFPTLVHGGTIMKSTPIRYALLNVCVLLLLTATISVSAQIPPRPTGTVSVKWQTYLDPRFDFTVEYPEDWVVLPRDDSRGASGTVSFVSEFDATNKQPDFHHAPIKIEIGLYLVPWSDRGALLDNSLKGWTDRYNELGAVAGIESQITQSYMVAVDQQEALYEEGKGLSDFRYVNVPRGDIVWFIWSNIQGDSGKALYDHMIASFRFGKHTPLSLREVYGTSFRPSHLSGAQLGKSALFIDGQHPTELVMGGLDLSSSWKSPLKGTNLTATCHSTAHNNDRSKYAIDVARPEWTEVYNSRQGSVTFAGWNTSGFGNLVKVLRDGLTSYSAHLIGIEYDNVYYTAYINTGTLIGWVGSTGQSSGNHLHGNATNFL